MNSERWLPVPGWENLYAVSDSGRVASLDRVDAAGRKRKGRVMRPAVDNSTGHLALHLRSLPRVEKWLVHRLVLVAFVGPAPSGAVTRHLNGVAADNRLTNIEWNTQVVNRADQVRLGERRPQEPKSHCVHGHEIASVGRTPSGVCRECLRIKNAAKDPAARKYKPQAFTAEKAEKQRAYRERRKLGLV